MKTRILKEELLEVIEENMSTHRDIFLKAIDGYKKEAINQLEEMLERVKKGNTISGYWNLIVPEDHTPEYERTIKMIEFDTRDEIELNENEFSQFVMDNWAWKKDWSASNTLYIQ